MMQELFEGAHRTSRMLQSLQILLAESVQAKLHSASM